MAVKDISDVQVLKAYEEYRANNSKEFPHEILMRQTGQPEKVCYKAMERAYKRDLIAYGISPRTGWLTEKGKQLLKEPHE